MATFCRQPIKSLKAGDQNSFVIGVIIHSLNVKTFDGTNSRYNHGERAVWSFTLRDSPEDTINVSVWGNVDYVKRLVSICHIGSVVEVINGKIGMRRINDKNEVYVPGVSSHYSLTVNENNSLVQLHDAPDCDTYESLLNVPMKKFDDVASLKNIFGNIDEKLEQYVNILVVVTFVSADRSVTTRDGRVINCRSLEAQDSSVDMPIFLMLWEKEWVNRAANWKPMRTVLFLSDARIAYDDFKKQICVTIVRKTVITEDPDIVQAEELRHAIRRNSDNVSKDSFAVPNANSITNLMTIKDITDRLNREKSTDRERIQFTALVKAEIEYINVNSPISNLLIRKCALCKKILSPEEDSCMDLECPCGNGCRQPLNVVSLNLKLNIKDNTGYLIGCRLTGATAESVMGCSATQFEAMKYPERDELQWKFLAQECNIRLHIIGPSTEFGYAIYNVVSIDV